MAREGAATDFDVSVDGIGVFRFAKRTMRDEIKIQVEFARMIEGVTPTDWLQTVCGWLSTLGVLTVQAPDGWDLSSIDPLDDDTYGKLLKVHSALVAKERSFRGDKGEGEPAKG